MTLGSEKTLDSLWQMEEFARICSREQSWEAVADEEANTPLETEMQGEEHKAAELWRRFWDKRPDGMVIDKNEKFSYVLEFKRARIGWSAMVANKRRRKGKQSHNIRVWCKDWKRH